ncbi:MAG: class I SAM-dependent methyltransferase [Bacteroidota bacterium]
MDHNQETFNTWNKVAKLYQEKFSGLRIYDRSYDEFYSTLKNKNARLLDIGCGPGIITGYLLSKNPDLLIDGIDISPNMISLAQKNYPKATFQVMDSRDIKKIRQKYHGIICGFCLPYLSEHEATSLIKDVYDLLNENGTFYISFVDGDPVNSGYKTASTGDRTYFNYYKTDFLIDKLTSAGFEIISSLQIAYELSNSGSELHTVLISKK